MEKEIHVLASPFPSHQGTQQCVDRMVDARSDVIDAELLCYDGADESITLPHFPVRRIQAPFVDDSLRSTVSWKRVAQDLWLMARIRDLERTFRGRIRFVAHNVQAALAAQVSGVEEAVYVAHTLFEAELPIMTRLPVQQFGAVCDRFAARARARFAVSPWLARKIGAVHLPTPWSAALAAESVPADTVVYAGNLDAYQGVELLASTIRLLRTQQPELNYILLTNSPLPHSIEDAFFANEIHSLSEQSLNRFMTGRALLLCPRTMWGGLPMKLLDARSRGIRVVATPAASALRNDLGVCTAAPHAEALASCVLANLSVPPLPYKETTKGEFNEIFETSLAAT